jgi:hypothetical protein
VRIAIEKVLKSCPSITEFTSIEGGGVRVSHLIGAITRDQLDDLGARLGTNLLTLDSTERWGNPSLVLTIRWPERYTTSSEYVGVYRVNSSIVTDDADSCTVSVLVRDVGPPHALHEPILVESYSFVKVPIENAERERRRIVDEIRARRGAERSALSTVKLS